MSKHTAEDLKGRLKEAAGDLTDDEKLQREGKLDQARAGTKNNVDDVADKIKDAISPKK